MSGRKPLLAEIETSSVGVVGGDAGEPSEDSAQQLWPDALGVVPTWYYPQMHALELDGVPPVHRQWHDSVAPGLHYQQRAPGAPAQRREPAHRPSGGQPNPFEVVGAVRVQGPFPP